VVPSTYADPAPLVILESFANAVPVVGTRIGGISDLIDQCRTGWLCAPGNSAELFDILSDRVSAGRSTLPEKAAFFRFQSERTPQRVAERYEAVYRLTINEFLERQLSPHG
jgi:glycogen(starch) synthase